MKGLLLPAILAHGLGFLIENHQHSTSSLSAQESWLIYIGRRLVTVAQAVQRGKKRRDMSVVAFKARFFPGKPCARGVGCMITNGLKGGREVQVREV